MSVGEVIIDRANSISVTKQQYNLNEWMYKGPDVERVQTKQMGYALRAGS